MSGSKPYYGPFELLTMEEAASRCDLGLIAFGKRLRDGSIRKPLLIGDLERWMPEWLEDYRWSATRGCALYMIGTDGSDFVKIGIAQSVKDRLKTLQTGCPFDLVPLVTMPDDSLRADCERLMRRLVKTNAPRRELQILADVLDGIIEKVERT